MSRKVYRCYDPRLKNLVAKLNDISWSKKHSLFLDFKSNSEDSRTQPQKLRFYLPLKMRRVSFHSRFVSKLSALLPQGIVAG